jgi:hypothetical protein
MPPETGAKQKLAPIGEINGKISWQSGQLRSIDIVGPEIASVFENIQVQPISLTVVPSTVPGEFGSTKVENIAGSSLSFGAVQKNGGAIWVMYKVSKLPLGTPIQLLLTAPKDGGNFVRVGEPVGVQFGLLDSVANNFDFAYTPA